MSFSFLLIVNFLPENDSPGVLPIAVSEVLVKELPHWWPVSGCVQPKNIFQYLVVTYDNRSVWPQTNGED